MAKKAPKNNRKAKPTTPNDGGEPIPLVASLDLETVRIVRSQSNLTIKGNVIPIQMGIAVTAKCGIADAKDTILGDATFVIEGPPPHKKPDGEHSSVHIEFVVQVVFKSGQALSVESLTDEDKGGLLSLTVFTAWPYARQFATAMTSGMGIPPFVMPLLKRDTNGQLLLPSEE